MYDPRAIIDNLRRLLAGDEPVAMRPWYRGFKGRIDIDEGDKSYRVSGGTHATLTTSCHLADVFAQRGSS
jgi:hypothetical protein